MAREMVADSTMNTQEMQTLLASSLKILAQLEQQLSSPRIERADVRRAQMEQLRREAERLSVDVLVEIVFDRPDLPPLSPASRAVRASMFALGPRLLTAPRSEFDREPLTIIEARMKDAWDTYHQCQKQIDVVTQSIADTYERLQEADVTLLLQLKQYQADLEVAMSEQVLIGSTIMTAGELLSMEPEAFVEQFGIEDPLQQRRLMAAYEQLAERRTYWQEQIQAVEQVLEANRAEREQARELLVQAREQERNWLLYAHELQDWAWEQTMKSSS